MTPRERLASLRAQLARVLRRTLDQHDVTQAAMADVCGTTSQKAQAWCDPTRPEGPSVAHLPQMPRAVAMELLRWAAEPHGLTVVERLAATSVASHLGHLHRVLKEGADVSVGYSSALADGLITPDERERLISELRESVAAETSLLHALESEGSRSYTKVRLVGGESA